MSKMKGRRSKSTAVDEKSAEPLLYSSSNPLDATQEILRKRLSQCTAPHEIYGFQSERVQLTDLVRRTALSGESNSVLVTGPRGSGKSVLLRSVLAELEKDVDLKSNLLQVHLNGLLQTDDKIALKEITRQLKLENTLGDRVFGSFAETLQFLLEALKSGSQTSKPILFVLDEFDLFASHKNQTLLYNLFDIAQSAQAPICVVGLTCRLDVIELLEKRVKSRFSHRQVHLFNTLKFQDYIEVFKLCLGLPANFPDKKFIKKWNSSIEELSCEATVLDALKRQFHFNKDVRALMQLLWYPVSQLSEAHPMLTTSDFIESLKILTADTKSAMLHGISVLELCMIIAMKHLTELYEGTPFNFEMIYSEYLKFTQKSSLQAFDKAVVLKAFEHLVALELVKYADSAGTRVQKEYRLMSLLIHPSQILDALQKYPNCPTEVKHWASTPIVS